MRTPAVAGQFYPASRDALVAEIEGCYANERGPGRLPTKRGDARELTGLVVPHAGYMYSGPVAAHAFLALAEDGLPETVVIVGPNHTGRGMPLAVATEPFDTPLGVAALDAQVTDALLRDPLAGDMEAHRYEHSLEVMLPFLLHLSPDLQFAFVCMGRQDGAAAQAVGRAVSEALRGRDGLVLASTDFSHYVPPAVAARKDRLAIDAIVEGDAKGLLRVVEGERITMCGYGPVAASLIALDGPEGEALAYGNSADAVPMDDVVGYAALALRT